MPKSTGKSPIGVSSPVVVATGEERSVHARCLAFIDRIKSVNPQLKAFSELLEPSALQAARAQDRRHEAGDSLGCLSGLLAAVKDNIDTFPAAANAGLSFLQDHRPASDATVVRLLRENGTIILGVTETDSGAFGVTTPKVTNPVYPDSYAGGSSGGSAAAVAAGLCDFAIGTDTGGSIRIPAACCGIFGFKPTYGTVPLRGVRRLTHSCDHIGPLARGIDMIDRVLRVLSNASEAAAISGPRQTAIGIPWESIADSDPVVLQAVEDFAETQTNAGFEITSVRLPSIEDVLDVHIHLSLREAAELYRDLSKEEMSALPDVVAESLQIGTSVDDTRWEALEKKKKVLVAEIDVAIDSVDFVILPTLPIPPPPRSVSRVQPSAHDIDLLRAMVRYTAIFNQTGHPALAFPWAMRNAEVLPSLQLIGPRYSDFRLLRFAKEGLKLDDDADIPLRTQIPQ